MPDICLSFKTLLANMSKVVANSEGESGHPCPVPLLAEKNL